MNTNDIGRTASQFRQPSMLGMGVRGSVMRPGPSMGATGMRPGPSMGAMGMGPGASMGGMSVMGGQMF